MTSVYGPAASHERRVKGLEQPGEDIARSVRTGERSALVANLEGEVERNREPSRNDDRE